MSCYGAQPWNFIICDRSRDEAAWNKALECLAEGNITWAQNAPVLILAVAVEHFKHNGEPNRWAQYDTGSAGISLCLQATDLGLMAPPDGRVRCGDVQAGFSASRTGIRPWP